MNKKILAFAIGGLLALPLAAATTLEEIDVVTGHTVFADMSGFDDNIAAIAGHAESRVVWFNGQSIMNTVTDGFVYAVESGASCDPLEGENFEFQDYNMSFIDPNDVSHIVAHYTYECESSLFALDPLDLLSGTDTYHVWVTLTHELTRDDPIVQEGDRGRTYNFALAVETELMGDRDELTHSGDGGRTTSEINEGDSFCPEEGSHSCTGGEGDDEHEHFITQVDLFYSTQDQGAGADRADGDGAHPGTEAGCANDDHCLAVTTGTYEDPFSTT